MSKEKPDLGEIVIHPNQLHLFDWMHNEFVNRKPLKNGSSKSKGAPEKPKRKTGRP